MEGSICPHGDEEQGLRSDERADCRLEEEEFLKLSTVQQIKFWFFPLWSQWIWVILSLILLDLMGDWIAPRRTPPPPIREPSLSYPLNNETVSDDLLIALSAVLPFCCVAGFSFFFDKAAVGINSLSMLQSYSFGLLFMTVLKKVTGKPRPCFYAMCQWDWDLLRCTAEDKDTWKAYQAFPSGHALLSFAGLGFLTAFFVTVVSATLVKRPLSPLQLQVKALAGSLPLFLAAWIGVSRMFDHLHDGADVVGGAVIGGGCAWVGVWFMRGNRRALLRTQDHRNQLEGRNASTRRREGGPDVGGALADSETSGLTGSLPVA